MTTKTRALLNVALVLAIASALPACGKKGNRNPVGPDPVVDPPEPTPEPITCSVGSFCAQTPEGVTIVFKIGPNPDPRINIQIVESLELRFPLRRFGDCLVPALSVGSKGKGLQNGTFLIEGTSTFANGNTRSYSISGTVAGNFASGTVKTVWYSPGVSPYCGNDTIEANWTAEKTL